MQDLPEYHWLSDSSNGDITLRVKFEKGSVATIPDKKIRNRHLDPAHEDGRSSGRGDPVRTFSKEKAAHFACAETDDT